MMYDRTAETPGGYAFRPHYDAFDPDPGSEIPCGPLVWTVGGLVPPVGEQSGIPWARPDVPHDEDSHNEYRREETGGAHTVVVTWHGDDPMGAFLKVVGTDLEKSLAMWYRHAAEVESPWGIE
jgi:hypothetical protein